MVNAEFKVGGKDLFIVYETKAKTFLKAPVSWQVDIGSIMPKRHRK